MAQSKKSRTRAQTNSTAPAELPTCGIVRPIADVAGYRIGHWREVDDAISQSIRAAGFGPRLVSEGSYIGVILGRIVRNLFSDPIVVCDISTRNPNVMFELGLRLAADKPVVIIKDDATEAPFDTGALQYIEYPQDLRLARMKAFQTELENAVRNTAEEAAKPEYRSFLDHFGTTPTDLVQREASIGELVLEEVRALSVAVSRMGKAQAAPTYYTGVDAVSPTAGGRGLFGRAIPTAPTGNSFASAFSDGTVAFGRPNEFVHRTTRTGESLERLREHIARIVGVAYVNTNHDGSLTVGCSQHLSQGIIEMQVRQADTSFA